jgi:type I restriction enzyme R subunit
VSRVTESIVEDAALGWLEELGYAVLHGPDIAAGEPSAEENDREDRDIVQEDRLRPAALGPGFGWRT